MASFPCSLLLLLLQGAGQTIQLSGSVMRGQASGPEPLAGIMVTLHRVSERSGPVDSVRTDARGRFSLTHRGPPGDSAVYFASAAYSGLSYFSPFLPAGQVGGSANEIVVYDTTSRAIPVSVQGRHLVVTGVEADGARSIVEVYELAVDSPVTRVQRGAGTDGATWSGSTPRYGTGFRVTEGSVPEEAVTFASGKVHVFAPLSPASRQLSYAYGVAGGTNRLEVPIESATLVVELLIEDGAAKVSGASFREMPAAPIEGRTFRRFLAQDVPAGTIVRIELPGAQKGVEGWFLVGLIALVGAAMLLALARAYQRR